MKLIDKDALVAEIEKRVNFNKALNAYSRADECNAILSLINTLEVKEVDLEKEIYDFMAKEWDGIEEDKHFYDMIKNDLSDIAKHFFELGLSVNNPIIAADRCMAEEIIINLKRVEQDYRIDLTREMEWLRSKAQKGEEV